MGCKGRSPAVVKASRRGIAFTQTCVSLSVLSVLRENRLRRSRRCFCSTEMPRGIAWRKTSIGRKTSIDDDDDYGLRWSWKMLRVPV